KRTEDDSTQCDVSRCSCSCESAAQLQDRFESCGVECKLPESSLRRFITGSVTQNLRSPPHNGARADTNQLRLGNCGRYRIYIRIKGRKALRTRRVSGGATPAEWIQHPAPGLELSQVPRRKALWEHCVIGTDGVKRHWRGLGERPIR